MDNVADIYKCLIQENALCPINVVRQNALTPKRHVIKQVVANSDKRSRESEPMGTQGTEM